MADHEEPIPDSDGSSYFQKTVVLKDWWLIKCSKEIEGKRFGVAGIEIAASVETRAMRVFTSSPIIKAFDVFTLQASDGICITLRGFLNKERVVKSGFIPQISRDFIFGFPPCWEQICSNCFAGDPVGSDINAIPSIIDKAWRPILSPCKNTKRNLEDGLAESRSKSTVTETNPAEINNKDGCSGGSRARIKKTARSKSLRPQSKSVDLSKVQNTTNDGDHGSEVLNKAKSGDVEKDECDESKVQNCTDDGDHGSEGLDDAKSIYVKKDECEAIENDVILSANGCGRKHTRADNLDKVAITTATGESLTLEQRICEHEATRRSPRSPYKDLDKSSKPGNKLKAKKSCKTLKTDGNVVELLNHSGTKAKSAENNKKLDVNKVQDPTTNDGDHGSEGNDVEKIECVPINNEVVSPVDGCGKRHSSKDNLGKSTSKNAIKESLTSEQQKGKPEVTKASLHSLSNLNNSSKTTNKGKSKKSMTSLDWNVVEPVNHSGSEIRDAEENFSMEKTKRKIDFDVEVTPDNEVKKQKTDVVSTGSLGSKRSRSGRLLMSTLEFWRNQVPIYDMDRNLVQVKEGHETNFTASKGKASDSRKPRRSNKPHHTTLATN